MTLPQEWADLTHFSFGDKPEMANRLASLVVAGVKTASCSAVANGFEAALGEQQIVLSGEGCPVAVIETLTLDVLPFEKVTAAQAAQEGEGDLSYPYWRDAHKAYFQREGTYAAEMDVIFETFRLVAIIDENFANSAADAVKAERAEAHLAGYTALGADT